MEKKSTKIAYFVALGVFIVLLVILGIAYKGAPLPTLEVDGEMIETTTPFAGTFWSLLPPIVAIVLALISKEVYSSLFLGCLVGALLVSNFHPWETVVQLVEGDNGIVTTVADGGNIAIVMFLVILGIMVDLMNKAGGSEAFGRWAKKAVKSRAGAGLNGLLSPTAERLGAAGLVHQVHHDAQNDQEHHNGNVAAVSHSGDDAVVTLDQLNNSLPRVEVADQQRTHQAAQEQRGIHFLRDQGQHDGNDGGQQGPEGTGEGSGGLDHLAVHFQCGQRCALIRDAENDQQHDKDTQRYEIRYLCAFLFHYEIYLLMIYGAFHLNLFYDGCQYFRNRRGG